MPRARTVLTPKPAPRARKAKAKPVATDWRPRPGQPTWRVREPGVTDPKATLYCDDHDAAEMLAEPGSIIETLQGGLWGRPAREVPTVADLAQQGMAREVAVNGGIRWEITDLGQQVLLDAMMGVDE